ncbi:MAG: MFS transporter, partial [Spirochaetia bacterium]|nr:MFS transporter [Spirochaetia bacterium]
MKHILKNRNFIRLLTAQFIEQVGDSFMLMALIAWAMSMKEGGSAAANISILMFWIVLPIILLAPIAGVFVDMFKKKHIMFVTALARCIFIMLIFVITPHKEMWGWIYFLVFLKSVVSQFFIPAKSSIVPHIVAEKDLMDANSISAT